MCAEKICGHRSCFCCIVLLLCWISPEAQGAPVFGEVLTVRQPDGSFANVRIWGDEYYGVTETLDGYTLVRDPTTMFLCYAKLSEDGNDLLSTGVRPGQAEPGALGLRVHFRINPEAAHIKALGARTRHEERMRAAPGGRAAARAPTTGNVVGITLIIDFPDEAGTIAPGQVTNYCNQIGYTNFGNNGSIRDYFFDVSGGLLNYTNFVPTAYFTAANNKAYYTDENIIWGTRAGELVREALNDLNAGGFDFSQYDADGDTFVDAVNMFYVGVHGNNWAQGLWPGSIGLNPNWCADGVCIQRFQMTNMGASLTLATFCHENGHMLLGWPDLYDYDYDSNGIGRYGLMCNSGPNTNPVQPCAYCKYIAGWTMPTVLTPGQWATAPSTGNVSFIYQHPNLANEYYLIDNRQQAGRDQALPDAGLAIWRIDTTGNNSNQSHYLVTLVQADGDWDLENNVNSGDSTDLWAAPTYTHISPYTNPNTTWWDGSASGLYIDHISASGPNMAFHLETPSEMGFEYLRSRQKSNGSWSDNPAITAFAVLAMLNAGIDQSDSDVAAGLQYILNQQNADGSVFTDPNRYTYYTSIAMLPLIATGSFDPITGYGDQITRMRNWLIRSQWDENSSVGIVQPSDPWYGGFGYGNSSRPDLSNTQFALMGVWLADWGLTLNAGSTDATYTKALFFLDRCRDPVDGGSSYTPGHPSGFIHTMTAASVWSYTLCGESPTDPRVALGLRWLGDRYSLTNNDGWGYEYDYYYKLTLAKALVMTRTLDLAGHGWYTELVQLLGTEQLPDGSWPDTGGSWGTEKARVERNTAWAILAGEIRVLPANADLQTAIILASHADLHVYDPQDRHVGTNYVTNGLDLEIPGATFQWVDGNQVVNLSHMEAGSYRVELLGTSNGSFELTVNGIQNGRALPAHTWEGDITDDERLGTHVTAAAMVGPLTLLYEPLVVIVPPPIPTVSEWGLITMTLLLLTAWKIYFGRRRSAQA